MAQGQSKSIIGDIVKFLIFVGLIPLIIALTVAFCQEFHSLPTSYKFAFNWGVILYLIMHLLVYEPEGIYRFGQKLVSSVFCFFEPLVKVAPFFFPVYSILLLIVLFFENIFVKSPKFDLALIFLIAFTLIMHIALTAKAIKGKDANATKPNYFFTMSFIFVINMLIISLMFDLVIPEFAFTTFFKRTVLIAKEIYLMVFRQLF